MKTYLEKETKKIPLIGGTNHEEVELIWEVRILDDGYVVVELLDFDIITAPQMQ